MYLILHLSVSVLCIILCEIVSCSIVIRGELDFVPNVASVCAERNNNKADMAWHEQETESVLILYQKTWSPNFAGTCLLKQFSLLMHNNYC